MTDIPQEAIPAVIEAMDVPFSYANCRRAHDALVAALPFLRRQWEQELLIEAVERALVAANEADAIGNEPDVIEAMRDAIRAALGEEA